MSKVLTPTEFDAGVRGVEGVDPYGDGGGAGRRGRRPYGDARNGGRGDCGIAGRVYDVIFENLDESK